MENFKDLKIELSKCLCPPGNGVFTIHTASDQKNSLHETLYGKDKNIQKIWENSLTQLTQEDNHALILGIPSDTGGGILRGANWGPLYLRNEIYKETPHYPHTFDLGDVRVIPHLLHDKYLNEETIQKCKKALYNLHFDLPVSALSISEYVTDRIYKMFPNKRIFGIGGDHSCSYPLVKSYLKSKKENNIKTALIHFDAHTDLLVERLGIDICFGSWTSHILQYLPDPSLCFQIGIRSSGKPKEHWELLFGVNQYWSNEVKEIGPEIVAEEIIQKLEKSEVDELYVSFDIDALDSTFVSSTGTPEPDGLYPHEPMIILNKLRERFPITGADLMELAPFISRENDPVGGLDSTLLICSSISQFLLESLVHDCN